MINFLYFVCKRIIYTQENIAFVLSINEIFEMCGGVIKTYFVHIIFPP